MQLLGKVNGVEIHFDFYPPNQFRGDVPKNLTGVYIIQLQCIDDGGNTAEYANMFIKIDFDRLKVTVLPETYVDKINATNFDVGAMKSNVSDYRTSEVSSCFNPVARVSTYTYKELVL